MSSLVTDLLGQARRFSLPRPSFAFNQPKPDSPSRIVQTCPYSQQDDMISEPEHPPLRHDPGGSAASRRPSQSSVLIHAHVDLGSLAEDGNRLDDTTIPTNSVTLTADANVSRSRGDSSSTNHPNMSIPEPPSAPVVQSTPQDHSPLPEDDGMGLLRNRIFAIQAKEISHSDKAHLMHELLLEGYVNSRASIQPEQPLSPSNPRPSEKRASQDQGPLESLKFWQSALGEVEIVEQFDLADRDLEPTFVSRRPPTESTIHAVDVESDYEKLLGCEHYRRNVKLQCSTCNRWYTCRFCHDNVEDHILIRKETRNMLCMFCGTAQKASQTCVSCEAPAARYYCDICKLWNDDPDKPCYHCNDCGICRIGHGIGKDFYHCKASNPSLTHPNSLTNVLIEMLCMHRHIHSVGP